MPTDSRRLGACVVCGSVDLPDSRGRCVVCGSLAQGPDAAAVRQADLAISVLQRRYDALAVEWKQWADYRAYYVKAMKRDAKPGAAVERVIEPVREIVSASVAAGVAAPSGGEFAAPGDFAGRASAVAPVQTPAPEETAVPVHAPAPAPAPAPATAIPAPAAQTPQRRRAAAAREALTAPALLGVAGASLLVAAAIVFVALAWTSFSPATRGTVVLAVGIVVGALAVWVRRLGLTASAGAIGVVSMGFAGVASVAYFRDSGALGSFDTAAALLVAAVAGLILSRFSIPWVGSAAALAMAGSVVGFTVAATTTAGRSDSSAPGFSPMTMWIVVGTAGASALAATHRLWRWGTAKVIVSWGSVMWLTLVGLSVPLWVWFGDGTTLHAVLGILPAAALAVLASRWQLLATGPAALVLTLIAPALAGSLGASAWPQAAASVATVTCLLALGRWLPRRVLRPLFIGVSPAYAVVAISSATYSVAITIARVVAGTYVPDTQMWAGVAALLAGLAIATLRLWTLEWALLKAATVVGAVMVAVGAGITAFGLAELTGPPLYHSSVAVATAIAGVGLIAMTRVWWERPARIVSELAALAFLVNSAVHADWAVVIAELAIVFAVLIAIIPLAVFGARTVREPWWTLPFLVAGATALAPSVAARYGGELALIAAAAVLTACAIAWAAWRAPRALHGPLVAGLAPAGAIGLAAALGTFVVGTEALTSGDPSRMGSAWWDVAVLALGVGIAAAPRWHVPRQARAIVASIGAASLLIAGVGISMSAAAVWGRGAVGSAAAALLVGALVALPGSLIWRERRAAWVNGVGSAALATLAGASALGQVASTTDPLWLPLIVAVGATAALMIGAKWWPQVSLAPAVFLATGVGYALMARSFGAIAAVAVAAVIAAVTLWVPLSSRYRGLAAVGAAPAFALGLLTSVVGVLAAVSSVIGAPIVGSEFLEIGWLLLAHAATIAALLCVPRLAKGRERKLGEAVAAAGWVLAPLALGFAVTFTSLVGSPDSTWWRDASVTAVAAQIAAVISALGIACAFSSLVKVPLASRPVRRFVRIGATGWPTLVALIAAWRVYSGGLLWQAGALALAIALVGLLVAARWWPRAALAPAATLATAIPLVFLGDGTSTGAWTLPVSAVIVAALVWSERVPAVARRTGGAIFPGVGPLALGAIPAAIAALPLAMSGALQSFGALIQHVFVGSANQVDPRYGLALAAVVVAALSMRQLARLVPIIITIALVLVLAGVDVLVAAAVLMAVEMGLLVARRAVRSSARAAAIAGAGAALWASHDWLALALAALLLALVAVVVLQRRGPRSPVLAVLMGPLAAGLAAFSLGHGLAQTWSVWLAAPAAAIALVGVCALMWGRAPEVSARALPWLLALSPIAIAVCATSLASAGTVLLIAGVAWLGLVTKRVTGAQWYSASFASSGVALIMAGAGVGAIEAYTLAPAACALAIGIRAMRTHPEVSSMAALGPGLAIGLVPSYIALLNAPENLARTAWLTLAMVALALLGMSQRWFAPVAATAVTAVTVAVMQVLVGSNLVFRLFSFLVVGTLLLIAASWFEKIKALR